MIAIDVAKRHTHWMTKYVPAYDTELEVSDRLPGNVVGCLKACESIVAAHLEYRVPATFFITGRLLEAHGREFRELLDNELFEIASHSYSHKMLLDHPVCGPGVSADLVWTEISRGKELVEEVFQRDCAGFRPGCGFVHGFDGHPEVLENFDRAGLRYVSSDLWGEGYSLPAPLKAPRTYAADGYPALWELPACGWHENLLKGNNAILSGRPGEPETTLAYPDDYPRPFPDVPISTVDEELHFNNRYFIRKALDGSFPVLSLVWHPWSLHMFDPDMSMLRRTFGLVQEESMIEFSTYKDAIPHD